MSGRGRKEMGWEGLGREMGWEEGLGGQVRGVSEGRWGKSGGCREGAELG